ncbi:MAG: sulfurtransferase [Chloroflexota bacterium]|nr:sulfurtransferase [Chloroflexota bacterium]
MSEGYAHPRALVDTRWLARRLNDPRLAVVEADVDASIYQRGHIPGSVLWDLFKDLADPLTRDIPSPSAMEELLSRSGIGNDTTVVLYGDGKNRSATWAFWLLKHYRHRDVRILNGGRQKWLAEGRPLSQDAPPRPRAGYVVGVPAPSLRATRDYILARLGRPGFAPLDTRSREEFMGVDHPDHPQTGIQRLGRLPGAVHLEWDEAAAFDDTFLPAQRLREMYQRLGLTPDKEVVTYCRLGVRASYSWFVLKHLLGYPRVRNYDGSWTEWGNLVGVPIER